MAQIGDNDSGRFLPLVPRRGSAPASVGAEEDGDHRHLLAGIAALVDGPDLDRIAPDRLETRVLRAAMGRGTGEPRSADSDTADRVPAVRSFPDFGLHVFCRDALYVAIRCGPVGQRGCGGHDHNDQLSFELCVGGEPVLVDPGTYLYLASPDQRNRFRSTRMHNTLQVENLEQGSWPPGTSGLFRLDPAAVARVVEASGSIFVGEIAGRGFHHRRHLVLVPGGLDGVDESRSTGDKAIRFHFATGVSLVAADARTGIEARFGRGRLVLRSEEGTWSTQPDVVSPGYGCLAVSNTAVLTTSASRVRWSLRVHLTP